MSSTHQREARWTPGAGALEGPGVAIPGQLCPTGVLPRDFRIRAFLRRLAQSATVQCIAAPSDPAAAMGGTFSSATATTVARAELPEKQCTVHRLPRHARSPRTHTFHPDIACLGATHGPSESLDAVRCVR